MTGAGVSDAGANADTDGHADAARPADAMGESESELAGRSAQDESGQSSGADVLTLSLFGVMVIIASVCLVIW